jgi:hypothetical protein
MYQVFLIISKGTINGANIIVNSGTFSISSTNTLPIPIQISGGKLSTTGGSPTLSGLVTLSSGMFEVNAGTITLTNTINIASSSSLQVNGGTLTLKTVNLNGDIFVNGGKYFIKK